MNDLLNYRVSGNGRPVVLLHGFLESSTMWKHLEFPENIQQVAIDLPGHGNSSLQGITSMKEMSNEVQKLLNSLNINDYDVIGHSMGGYVGLELLKNDQRCAHLLLLNSNFW